MAAFDDFLSGFTYNPEVFNEEQFKAAVKAAHDEDLNLANAALTERDNTIKSQTERITQMGSKLWDYQMGQGPKIEDQSGIPNTSPDSGGGDHQPKNIDAMFKKVDRK